MIVHQKKKINKLDFYIKYLIPKSMIEEIRNDKDYFTKSSTLTKELCNKLIERYGDD